MPLGYPWPERRGDAVGHSGQVRHGGVPITRGERYLLVGFIGWGVFNPISMYRVRLLAHEEPALLAHRDIEQLLQHRLRAAMERRRALRLPSDENTAYRLVNGEGDRLSGLMVDVYAGVAVAVSSAIWLENWSDAVRDALLELPEVTSVVWRRNLARLKQDGWDARLKQDGGDADGERHVMS